MAQAFSLCGSMPASLPGQSSEFLQLASRIQAELQACKSRTALLDYGWYPYDSLAALPLVCDLISPVYDELADAIRTQPVADLGCGDGDWAMLFSRIGADVDAIDHRESNFNQMRGIDALRRASGAALQVHDLDLDDRFTLPRRDYGLILFFGTLYHLKNPFYVLETLSSFSDWCLLSTRVAQVTPQSRTRIADEPVAYLLDSREANNDPTNFWIFSPKGLTRLLERTGWIVVNQKQTGCSMDSDPVHGNADERMFVLLKSRTRHPGLHVRPLQGWHAIEQDRWRWTAKRFSLEVALPAGQFASEFALRFTVPEALIAAAGPICLSCSHEDCSLGSISCDAGETIEFRGRLPASAVPGSVLRLDFQVDSAFQPQADGRDLGVIIPLLDAGRQHTHRIPFRIS